MLHWFMIYGQKIFSENMLVRIFNNQLNPLLERAKH
jgi:hypothetical protein